MDNREPHNRIADRLDKILESARRPSADFDALRRELANVNHDVYGDFIDHGAIGNAISAVEECLGPKKIKTYRSSADAKISSLRIAGETIEKNTGVRPAKPM